LLISARRWSGARWLVDRFTQARTGAPLRTGPSCRSCRSGARRGLRSRA